MAEVTNNRVKGQGCKLRMSNTVHLQTRVLGTLLMHCKASQVLVAAGALLSQPEPAGLQAVSCSSCSSSAGKRQRTSRLTMS